MESFQQTVNNLFESKTLKWIFVGGKGGVGKTTTSSSIALQFALRTNKKVLIISTDPAHNLSDCFDQQFSKDPIKVNGIDNLFGLEIDPQIDPDHINAPSYLGLTPDKGTQQFLAEIISSIPGIDEAMSFSQLVKSIKTMQFDLIIFDTAPTGHTMRLLNFPELLDKGLEKIVQLKTKFSPLVGQFGGLFGNQQELEEKYNKLFESFEEIKIIVKEVNKQLTNKDETTFVCVCIPEFLSMYETERLVQKLHQFKVDIQNVVINQVIFQEEQNPCKFCKSRYKMQHKYIEQIIELYDDKFITITPMQEEEIRGIELLKQFGKLLSTEKVLPKVG